MVQSGRSYATYYKYLILDDYDQAPANWTKLDFNDTEWKIGATPFGDRPYNNVQNNTDWDTTGSSPYNNDAILIRHNFYRTAVRFDDRYW